MTDGEAAMTANYNTKSKVIRMLRHVAVFSLIIWTLLTAASLIYHFRASEKYIINLARESALEGIKKDILYRSWAARYGGVYVPVTDMSPPNPYLSHIKERDIATPSGRKLTLINPAYMTRQVHELAAERLTAQGHITSLKPFNPANKPDAWEMAALAKLEAGEKEFGEVVTMNGVNFYRIMVPLKTEQPCLKCHTNQGYRLEDIRGGISSSMPMENYEALSRTHLMEEMKHFATVWLIGLAGISFGSFYVRRRTFEGLRAEQMLLESEERYQDLVDLSPDAIYIHVSGRLIFSNRQGAELLGAARPEDLLGRQIMDFIHPSSRDRAYERIQGAAEKKESMPFLEEVLVRIDGTTVDVEITASLFHRMDEKAVQVVIRDITKRKENQKALLESERRFRTIVSTSLEGIIMIDVGGAITYVNDRLLDLLGYSREEMLGRNVESFMHEDERQEHDEQLDMRRKGVSARYERRFRRKDGSIIWTLASGSPLQGSDGSYQGSFGMVTDITERKRVEEMLKESERRFRDTLENVHLLGVGLDRSGNITFINTYALELLGWRREELIGKNWFGICLPSEGSPGVKRIFDQSLQAGDVPARHENEVSTREGERRMVAWNNTLLRNASGHVIGMISIGEDVTRRKQIEEALLASESRYRALFEQSRDGIFILEAGGAQAGRIVSANFAALDMHGYVHEEIGRLKIQDLLPASEAELVPERMERVRNEGGLRFETTHRRKNGTEFRAEVTATNIVIGSRHYFMSVHRDISGLKQAEARRRELEEQLLQSQKIESLGRLAGGVAHDINNMLMPIMGYAEMLSLSLPHGDSRKEDVEAIIKSSERVRDIARQLLAFARKQTLEMKVLDLNTVIDSFEKMLRRTIRENVIIKTRKKTPLPAILGDAGQIEQVILNLAINAQDAMPTGGVLIIETGSMQIDADFIARHKGSTAGIHVTLTVSDTGTGMSKDVLARIFDPFFTTKDRGQGTGLGLAMVYGITKQHGGYVDVTSEPGQGSRFRLYFPVSQEDPKLLSEKTTAPTAGGKETILVVEDQDEVLTIVGIMLKEAGYNVLRAVNAEAALVLSNESGRTIDLLISDVIMPGMNGTEIFAKLKKDHSGLKVLYMSGYPDNVISTHGVLRPGISFIQKPFALPALLSKVREVLSRPAAG